jgi:hypothetical protein
MFFKYFEFVITVIVITKFDSFYIQVSRIQAQLYFRIDSRAPDFRQREAIPSIKGLRNDNEGINE